MAYSHFIAKLTLDGGPAPADELRNIITQCKNSPLGEGWFKSRMHANEFERSGQSICVIFHHPQSNSQQIEAVVARVLTTEPPYPRAPADNDPVSHYYDGYTDLTRWWRLGGWPREPRDQKMCDAVLVRWKSLADIPGNHWESGKNAPQTFNGQCSFAGWGFPGNPLEWLQELHGERATR